ncbi:MAG: hypothetical protein H5T62_07490 [Anaerolineae bacterium]|nr:hypothetical protein [Anaerolineae bacterium]
MDDSSTLTLSRAYKPFGAVLEESGSGASAYGYFGAWWDSGLGLLYWDGRYYDPVTGRFLSPQRGRRNPYSPYGMPLTMGLLAPLVVWSAAFGKKRRRRWWHWLLLVGLVGVGVMAVGCEGETTPTIPVAPTLPPPPGTPQPPPSYTPPPTSTPPPPTPTPTLPPTATPTGTCTPTPGWRKLDQKFLITTYWTVMEDDPKYEGSRTVPLESKGWPRGRKFNQTFLDDVKVEGSGRLVPPVTMDDGREIKYMDYLQRPTERVDAAKPGRNKSYQAIPFWTAAADWTRLEPNSLVWVEGSENWNWEWPYPDRKGVFEIHDGGEGMVGDKIDIYVGEQYVRGDKREEDKVNVSMLMNVYIWEG